MRFDPRSFALGKQGDFGPVRDVVSYLLGRAVGAGGETWETITNVSVATFATVSSTLRALAINITPQQSGVPSPSTNIPIIGWSDVNVIVSPTLDAQDGTTYPISLGDGAPYYGGILDVITGVLTVTHSHRNSLWTSWVQVENTHLFYRNLTTGEPGGQILCAAYKNVNYNSVNNSICIGLSDYYEGRVVLRDDSCDSANALATKIQGLTNTELAIELKPSSYTIVQLSSTEVSAIIGQNNVWADSGNINTITFRTH